RGRPSADAPDRLAPEDRAAGTAEFSARPGADRRGRARQTNPASAAPPSPALTRPGPTTTESGCRQWRPVRQALRRRRRARPEKQRGVGRAQTPASSPTTRAARAGTTGPRPGRPLARPNSQPPAYAPPRRVHLTVLRFRM